MDHLFVTINEISKGDQVLGAQLIPKLQKACVKWLKVNGVEEEWDCNGSSSGS